MIIECRHCSKCGREYERSSIYFAPDKRASDGLQSACRECTRAASRKAYAKNPEKYREKARRWQQNNKERHKLANHDWYLRNSAESLQKNKAWRRNNPDKASAKNRRWKKANYSRVLTHNRNRRALLRSAEGTHTAEEIALQLKRQKKRCYYCHEKVGDAYHVDHVIPLSRGGRNDASNLVIACGHCNDSKQDRLPHEWVEGGRLL